MKRVSNWFHLGLLTGLIWLVIQVGVILVKIFGTYEMNQVMSFLYLDLLCGILNLVCKFFLLGTGIFYMFYVTNKWNEEQENKFDFEKPKQ